MLWPEHMRSVQRSIWSGALPPNFYKYVGHSIQTLFTVMNINSNFALMIDISIASWSQLLSVSSKKTHIVCSSCAVWLLQAPHQLRLHLRRRNRLDTRRHQLDGPGLPDLEQHRLGPLLQLPVVQGRRGGHLEAGLEARRRRQHHLPRLHRHRLLRWLLRVQEQPQGQRLRRRVEGRTRIRLIDDLSTASL
jgi:hypothetical protein